MEKEQNNQKKEQDKKDARNARMDLLNNMNTKIDEKKYKQFVDNVELLTMVLTRDIEREN